MPSVIVLVVTACLGQGDLLSLAGFSEKLVTSMMSSSMLGSKSSSVLVHFG